MLDAWTKDLISSYQYMNDKERMLVRSFLNLDLSVQKDIYLQDKMANGMVEAPRASIATSQATCPDDATSQVSGFPGYHFSHDKSRPLNNSTRYLLASNYQFPLLYTLATHAFLVCFFCSFQGTPRRAMDAPLRTDETAQWEAEKSVLSAAPSTK